MLLETLEKRFKDYTFYAIGGFCRNIIFKNNSSEDIDVLTNATEDEIYEILGRDFYAVKINDVIRVKDIERNSWIDICSYDDLEENLKSRDFEINTKLYDLHKKEFIGKVVIPMIKYVNSEYAKVIPLAPIRALRQSLQNNISMSEEVIEDLKNINIYELNRNNLRKEISQMLLCDNALDKMKEYGLLEKLIPYFRHIYGFNQNSKWHDLDLFEHINKAFKSSPKILEVRLALLFHDLEKIYCVQVREDGHYSYIGHEIESAKFAKTWLLGYETPHEIINVVCDLIENHMNKNMKVSTMVNKLGIETSKLLLDVMEADVKGRNFTMEEELVKLNNKRVELSGYEIKKSTECNPNKPTMVILVGLPRSGKSNFYKKHFGEYTYISRDEIRERVFGFKGNMENEGEVTKIFNEMLNEAFNKNKNIIIDNTNVQRKYRNKYMTMAKSRKYNAKAYLIDTEYSVVLDNANKEGFPIEVIESMQCRLNKPSYDEGYNEVYIVKTEFTPNEIKFKMEMI
jgi:tRNA nucleotidyltransferase (CCA-adding enzyme)